MSRDRQHVAVGWNLGPLLADTAEYVTHVTADNNEQALSRGKAIVAQLNNPVPLSRVDVALAKLHKQCPRGEIGNHT